jgi:hypothetical protein
VTAETQLVGDRTQSINTHALPIGPVVLHIMLRIVLAALGGSVLGIRLVIWIIVLTSREARQDRRGLATCLV